MGCESGLSAEDFGELLDGLALLEGCRSAGAVRSGVHFPEEQLRCVSVFISLSRSADHDMTLYTDRWGRTFEDFQKFIETSPHLAQQIRSLTLSPRRVTGVELFAAARVIGSEKTHSPKLDLDFYALESVLSRLPALRELFLCAVDLGLASAHALQHERGLALCSDCGVQHLYYSRGDQSATFAPDDLFFFLNMFPHLRSLSIEYIWFDLPKRLDATVPLDSMTRYQCLKEFKTADSNSLEFIDIPRAAVERGGLPALQALDVDIHLLGHLQPLQELLELMDDQLTSLTLRYNMRRMVEEQACTYPPVIDVTFTL